MAKDATSAVAINGTDSGLIPSTASLAAAGDSPPASLDPAASLLGVRVPVAEEVAFSSAAPKPKAMVANITTVVSHTTGGGLTRTSSREFESCLGGD
jgi:hypothetical protein